MIIFDRRASLLTHGLLISLLPIALADGATVEEAPAAIRQAQAKYLQLPLAFEKRQNDGKEEYLSRGQGYTLALRDGKAFIGVKPAEGSAAAVSLEFAGGRKPKAIQGEELPGKVNLIFGNDPKKWQLGLPTYGKVTYGEIYPGIDVVYYGNQQQLEFDLLVKPGADPEAIRLKLEGAGRLSIDDSGALNLGDAAGGLRVALPQIYQEVNGAKKRVPGHYTIVSRDEVAFRIDPWDHTRPLVIDPTIAYSTLLGGGLNSSDGFGIKVDSNGNILIGGYTFAADFPTFAAFQSKLKGSPNVFVTSITSTGALNYSTYLGGSFSDKLQGLAVDSTGAAWVTGSTSSGDFPTKNAAQSTISVDGTSVTFVTKLSSAGALQFSTFLNSSNGNGIAVDKTDNVYVTGSATSGFATTAGAIVSTLSGSSIDAFVTKYNSTGGPPVYSTMLGGGADSGSAIAVDLTGNAYVTGLSLSSSFAHAPTGGAQTTNNGGNGDAFVAKLKADGTALLYFTFLGGAGSDQGTAIAVDGSGDAYIAGQTSSMGLAKGAAVQPALGGVTNGFAAELNPSGSAFTYITYLGGSRVDSLTGLALDSSGSVYLAGYTDSVNFPTQSAIQSTLPGNGISLFNSANSGGTWAAFDSNIPGAVFDASISPAGTAVVLTESGIYRAMNVNGGASWIQMLNAPGSFNGSHLARSAVAPGTIYAAVCCSNFNNFFIDQSTDDGLTWFSGQAPSQVAGLVADPLTANTVYLFGNSFPYVFKSTDGGVTWNPAASGLPGVQVGSMVATTDGALYAGTYGSGIYKSVNQGSSWVAVNSGLPQDSFSYSAHSLSASGTTVYFALGSIYETTNGGASWTPTPGSVSGGAHQNCVVACSDNHPSFSWASVRYFRPGAGGR